MNERIKGSVIPPIYSLPLYIICIHDRMIFPYPIYTNGKEDLGIINEYFLNYGLKGVTLIRLKDGIIFDSLQSFYEELKKGDKR
jgi:hypothetical protein